MKHIKYNLCIYEYLNENYSDIIYNMIRDEFYIIQDKVYDIYYEITVMDDVVGFIGANFDDGFLICELCYILPSFRGMGLFSKVLNVLKLLFNIDILLELPNVSAVYSLILNNHAIKLNERLVLCNFFLCFSDKTNHRHISRLYDLENGGIIDLKNKVMSPLQEHDIKQHQIQREIIDDNYFYSIMIELIKTMNH